MIEVPTDTESSALGRLRHIEELIANLPDDVQDTIATQLERRAEEFVSLADACDERSPPAQMLAVKLKSYFDHLLIYGHRATTDYFRVIPEAPKVGESGQEYHPDFTVEARIHDQTVHVLVECDGREYHEEDTKAAAMDKRRDRDLIISGWRVIRFPAADITRNPLVCCTHISNFLQAEAERRAGIRWGPDGE